MSDSAKLRFVYGILFLIGAFLCFGTLIALIFLLIFVIPESHITDIIALCICAFILFIIFLVSSVFYFIDSGMIRGKNIKSEEEY